MMKLRKSGDRGAADHGWLKSQHSFSFASYLDPAHMGFRSLRVINEDRIQGGTGFGAHSHRDMEIISYVVKGSLEHQDSMGTKAIIRPGEVQRMSAGSGVTHSEHNHEKDSETHFFQIWIEPNVKGSKPGYGQKSFEKEIASRDLVLVASQNEREGSIAIQQDADLYVSRLSKDKSMDFKVRRGRGVWLHVIRGALLLKADQKSIELKTGDALAVWDEDSLKVQAMEDSEALLFDLA